MTQLPDDQRWNQWNEWFQSALDQIMALAFQRFIWKNLVAMLQSNTDVEHHQYVNDWLVNCYAQSQAVGVRRQWDHADRRPTIGCLLKELAAFPRVAQRSRFMSNCASEDAADTEFSWRVFALDGGTIQKRISLPPIENASMPKHPPCATG